MANKKFGPFPFVPNMDDCRRIIKTNGVTCYIMDTCCRNITPEEQEAIDRQIAQIAMNAAFRKAAQGGSA